MRRKRQTVLLDDVPFVDINFLLKIGALDGGERLFPRIPHQLDMLGRIRTYRHRVDLALRASPTWHMFRVEWTRCNYGGKRPWFICKHCGRRVGKLYIGLAIACRHCFNGAYRSDSRGKNASAHHRACSIRFSLGGEPSLRREFPQRPARMWRRKYNSLRHQCEMLEATLPASWRRRPPDYPKFIKGCR